VFKEVAYFTQDPLEKDQSLLLEGLSYLLSNRPDLTEVALEQRSRPSAQEFLLRILSAVQRGQSFSETNLQALMRSDPESGRFALLFLSLAHMRQGEDTEAFEVLRRLEGLFPNDPLLITAQERLTDLQNGPRHSPFLVGAASAILPGSGQFLTGHYFDGLQALTFLGLFGAATYASYLYEADRDKGYIMTGITGGITATFYASNILGASKTAEYANQNSRDKVLNPWEDLLWGYLTDFILLGSPRGARARGANEP
jgi:hypothetical protein